MLFRRGDNKTRDLEEEDDGRTIVDMNVEGMPWYMPGQKKDGAAPQGGSFPGMNSGMSDEELKMYRFAAVKSALLIVLVFALVFGLFIAFCDFIWFK